MKEEYRSEVIVMEDPQMNHWEIITPIWWIEREGTIRWWNHITHIKNTRYSDFVFDRVNVFHGSVILTLKPFTVS